MNKIITVTQAREVVSKLKQQGRNIVLAGGCFDILHVGHVTFLNNAKKNGDLLVVLLESDRKVAELKGEGRPVNNQKDRAKVLASLESVDYVVILPFLEKDEEYDELIKQISPDIIATTKGDLSLDYKQRTAEAVGAEIVEVTDYINEKSTTKLLSLLGNI